MKLWTTASIPIIDKTNMCMIHTALSCLSTHRLAPREGGTYL